MCRLSGNTFILHSQCALSRHFLARSSRDISTPPYDCAHGPECSWIIGKKFDNIIRNVSHARVKWLQKDLMRLFIDYLLSYFTNHANCAIKEWNTYNLCSL